MPGEQHDGIRTADQRLQPLPMHHLYAARVGDDAVDDRELGEGPSDHAPELSRDRLALGRGLFGKGQLQIAPHDAVLAGERAEETDDRPAEAGGRIQRQGAHQGRDQVIAQGLEAPAEFPAECRRIVAHPR